MNLPYECENVFTLKQMWGFTIFFPNHVSGNVISEVMDKENKTKSYDFLNLYVVLCSWWSTSLKTLGMIFANLTFVIIHLDDWHAVECFTSFFTVFVCILLIVIFSITKWFRNLLSMFVLVTCILRWCQWMTIDLCLEGFCSLLLHLELKHIHGLLEN